MQAEQMVKSTFPLFMKRLFSACQAAPSADNSQPCHIDWSPSKLILRYDVERVSGFTFPFESRATALSASGIIENIAQCYEKYGVDMAVTYFPVRTSDKEVFAEINLGKMRQFTDDIMTDSLFIRHTNRFSYKNKEVPKSIVDNTSSMTSSLSKITFFEDRTIIDTIGKQVQYASEIRFQTQEVHEWLERSLRFTPEQVKTGDGLDIRTLDLPPGGGAFLRFISNWQRMRQLNRVGAYKLLAAMDASQIKKAPAVVSVTARNTPVGALEAGRLLSRAWTYLNAQGIACHPYYVIADQLERLEDGKVPVKLIEKAKKIRINIQKLLGINEDETLMMLLRVGYPTREAPRSQRVSMDQVFTELPSSKGS